MPAPHQQRNQVAGTAIALFVLALFITAYSARNPWTVTVGAEATSLFLRPFQAVHRGASAGLSSIWLGYINLVGVRAEQQSLLERLRALEAQNSKLLEFESENTRLRGLLDFREQLGLKGVAARVIGFDPSNWSKIVTLDIGATRGVERGQAVVEGNGVVGQVVAVGQLSSRVLLIVDHTSGVDAIVQGGRGRGVIQGTGGGCELLYVPNEEELQVGDRVITSGMDGIYPKGLLLGVIAAVERRGTGMFQQVVVRPAVDFRKLEELLVLHGQAEVSAQATPAERSAKGARQR